MSSDTLVTESRMTPSQRRVFSELLMVGQDRPLMPIGLVEELTETIRDGCASALASWSEPKMWLSKSTIGTVLRCEGQLVADRATPRRANLHPSTAVGIVAHRAIALSHTHPGLAVGEYVAAARKAAMSEDSFAQYWDESDIAVQSDLISASVSKTTIFLDSFPPLSARWTPRFEESLQAQVGKLVMSAKPDFVLGRPRADGSQSMFLADMKTGGLNDEHEDEAMFYALVATLRFKVAPWRSVVFSLASGEWTDPDVTGERLRHAANRVVAATTALCAVMGDQRAPNLHAGRWCSWCPAAATCSARAEQLSQG